jgi:hypothetical protein
MYRLPKIIRVINRPENNMICLIEPSDLLSFGDIVSFYVLQNDYEELIGTGIVLNKQENGFIQVLFNNHLPAHEEVIEQMGGNNKDVISNVLVKISTPSSAHRLLMEGRDEQ